MSLFNLPRKKTKAKLEKITDNVDVLDEVKNYGKNVPISSLRLVQENPYPLYIDIDTNNMFISYDNTTLEQVDYQTGLKELNLNPNEEFSITANIDATNIVDAVGTIGQGTFNKSPWILTETPTTTTTTENELEKRLKELESKLAKTVSLVHNCANCGATLEVEENKPVIHCKYCGSTYIVGTTRVYSNY